MSVRLVRPMLVAIFCLVFGLFYVSVLRASSNIDSGHPCCTEKSDKVTKHRWAAAFNCIDSRCQNPVRNGTQEECSVDEVDAITKAGVAKPLAENKNKRLIDYLRGELEISVKAHGTKKVTITAHENCFENPVSREDGIRQLSQAKKTVESWDLGVEVILLWVPAPFTKAEVVK